MTAARYAWMLCSVMLGSSPFALGCDPAPAGDPEAGGQTGDPSAQVPDYVSAIVPAGTSGSCAPAAATLTPRRPVADRLAGRELAVLADGDLVVADFAFGLQRVAASDPGRLDAGAALALESAPTALLRVDEARVVVVAERELLLVSLAQAQPRVLSRAALAGEARASQLRMAEGSAVVDVLVDRYAEGRSVCKRRERTLVVRFGVGAQALEALPEVDLGDAVQAARFEAGLALVAAAQRAPEDEWKLSASGLRLVALDEAAPEPGEPLALSGAVTSAGDIAIDGATLRVLVRDVATNVARLERFDLGDRADPLPLPGCEFALTGLREWITPENERWFGHRSAFTADGLVVRDGVDDVPQSPEEAAPSSGRVVRLDAGQCDVRELVLPPAAEFLLGPEGRLLALGGARRDAWTRPAGPIELALFDLASATEPVASASIAVDAGEAGDAASIGIWPEDATLLPGAVQLTAGDVVETALLLVPAGITAAGYRETLALVSIGAGSITARGQLDAGARIVPAGERLYAVGGERLSVASLDGAALPELLGARAIWPAIVGGWLVDGAIAQYRDSGGDNDAEEPDGMLELVEPGDRPLRDPLGELALPAGARLFRVGDLLVVAEDACQGAPSNTLRVLDVADPSAPRELARLDDVLARGCWPERGIAPPSLVAEGAAGEDALVLRSQRQVDDDRYGHDVYAFHLLDLREPAEPVLHDLEMPESQPAAGAWFAEDKVYYSYAEPIAGGEGAGDDERPETRYFMQVIDFGDRSEISVADPIQVPGVVVGADGDALYLRDVTWDGDELRDALHRVRLANGEAHVMASLDTPSPAIGVRPVGDGVLAVSLLGDQCFYCEEGPAALWLVSADDLAAAGELEVAGSSRIVGRVAQKLVLDAPYVGLQVIDVADPSAPSIEHTISSASVSDLRDGRLLYVRGFGAGYGGGTGALFGLDLR